MADGWHEVLSNTENLSHAMRNVAFLDQALVGFARGERGEIVHQTNRRAERRPCRDQIPVTGRSPEA
jgi:hypothetical protein